MDVLKESLKKITPIDWKEDDIVAEKSKSNDENLNYSLKYK